MGRSIGWYPGRSTIDGKFREDVEETVNLIHAAANVGNRCLAEGMFPDLIPFARIAKHIVATDQIGLVSDRKV